MVGAVLTQNTNWGNVEKAIYNLRKNNVLDLDRLLAISEKKLARLIYPSGFFNIKARRLKNMCQWLHQNGGEDGIAKIQTRELRNMLLNVNGIGQETADAILLYAFERPVFVIDAYTRRLLKQLGLIIGNETYETLRTAFESSLDPDVPIYNEYHALIVCHAKQACDETDNCRHCLVESRF